jgi:hypothetical protein
VVEPQRRCSRRRHFRNLRTVASKSLVSNFPSRPQAAGSPGAVPGP